MSEAYETFPPFPPGLPPAPFSLQECEAMARVIQGYAQFLGKAPLLPEEGTQERRNQRIAVLKSVADRFEQQLATNPQAIALPLNAEELDEVVQALLGFVNAIRHIMPQTVSRDETLQTVHAWCMRMVGSLSGHPGRDSLN